MFFTIIVTAIALAYFIWDVNYFLRISLTTLVARCWFKKQFKVNESTTLYSICTSQDIDIYLTHMNNARFVRELDFARMHFYVRTGMYKYMRAVRGHVLQAAAIVRYRKPIRLYDIYKIETKLLYWEGKDLYVEHQFITTSDSFIRAVVLTKQRLVKIEADTICKVVYGTDFKPEIPEEVKYWIQSIEASSERLRKSD